MDNINDFNTDKINSFVFHPRQENYLLNEDIKRLLIEVDEDVSISASFFEADKKDPFILYFHGNGEIASDYDDLGPLFVKNSINFLAVDYRGYGKSTGTPEIVSMLEDSLKIAEFTKEFKRENKFTGSLIVMGRSLGSASALELVYSTDIFDALIIESGFSDFINLLFVLGFNTKSMEIKKDPFFHNEKIKNFKKPILIIHGENDQIIPIKDGKDLFKSSSSNEKKFIEIKQAGHNTIFTFGLDIYFQEIKNLTLKCKKN